MNKYLKCLAIGIPILIVVNLILYLFNIKFDLVSYIEGVLVALLTVEILRKED